MIIRKSILNSIYSYRKYKKSILGKKPKRNKLTYNLKRSYGRNNSGKITVRHKSRGVKRLYRDVNFYRNSFDKVGTIINIEYDPNRNAFLSLVEFEDKAIEYNIHIEGVKIGDSVVSSLEKVTIAPGNATILANIPQGHIISNITNRPGGRAIYARSSGTSAIILEQTKTHCLIKIIRSGFVIRLSNKCMATIGEVSNAQFQNKLNYKAGQKVKKGIRPTVRGVAMNPVDHPHGGGEGRGHVNRHPVSYTCRPAKGGRTRGSRSRNNKSIINRSIKKK